MVACDPRQTQNTTGASLRGDVGRDRETVFTETRVGAGDAKETLWPGRQRIRADNFVRRVRDDAGYSIMNLRSNALRFHLYFP